MPALRQHEIAGIQRLPHHFHQEIVAVKGAAQVDRHIADVILLIVAQLRLARLAAELIDEADAVGAAGVEQRQIDLVLAAHEVADPIRRRRRRLIRRKVDEGVLAGTVGAALPESFDAILLDAPCSGEGVVRKDPDAMSNWSPDSVAEIAATQRELIDSAFHALAPSGVMVYSTCTLNAQENQQVVRWLLDTYGDAVSVEPLGELFPGADKALTAEGFLHVFPQIYDSEGFFVARLRKKHAVAPLVKPTYKVGKFPFSPLSGKEAALVAQAAAASGLTWGDDSRLWERDKEIWLFPAELEPLFGKVRFSRIGLKLAERFPKGFRWQHEAAIALAGASGKQHFELDAALAQEWYHGRDLYPEQPPAGDECIVTYQGQPLGIAKRIGSRIKNNLPRELVRDGVLDFHL